MSKPVVLVVMDGVGWTDKDMGNAVLHAYKPQIDELMTNWPHTTIKASGTAVGLPSDGDMGNSEVGHNALGCGQIYSQGAKLVNESIESGDIYKSSAWVDAVKFAKEHGGKFHFIGLLSDGNVHSNISHLIAMMKECKKEGLNEVRVHALLDGRMISGSVSVSPYTLLNLCTISLHCSNIGSWSSPTGTAVARKAVISAAWLIG